MLCTFLLLFLPWKNKQTFTYFYLSLAIQIEEATGSQMSCLIKVNKRLLCFFLLITTINWVHSFTLFGSTSNWKLIWSNTFMKGINFILNNATLYCLSAYSQVGRRIYGRGFFWLPGHYEIWRRGSGSGLFRLKHFLLRAMKAYRVIA